MQNMPLEALVAQITQKETHRFIKERKRYMHVVETWLEKNDFIVDIEREMEKKELSGHIRTAVSQLDDTHAEIIRLHFYDDLDVCELSRALQIAPKEVNNRISTALSKLKPILGAMT